MALPPVDELALGSLSACRLFAGLDEATMATVARALRRRRYRRGEIIFHAGDPGDALFIVASGSVRVVLPSDEGAEPAIVAVLGAGEFFGELLKAGEIGYELSLDPRTPIVIGIYPMRPIPRS